MAPGDVDGNGTVDSFDEFIITLLQGLTFEDNDYNLAADVNADGIINQLDLPNSCMPGDTNMDGAIDLLDIASFVDTIIANQFLCEADINTDGVVDLLDIQPFVDLLTQ